MKKLLLGFLVVALLSFSFLSSSVDAKGRAGSYRTRNTGSYHYRGG